MGFLGTLTSEPLSQLSPLKPEIISSRMLLHHGAVTDGRRRRHSQLTTACLAPGDVTLEVAEFLAHVNPWPDCSESGPEKAARLAHFPASLTSQTPA